MRKSALDTVASSRPFCRVAASFFLSSLRPPLYPLGARRSHPSDRRNRRKQQSNKRETFFLIRRGTPTFNKQQSSTRVLRGLHILRVFVRFAVLSHFIYRSTSLGCVPSPCRPLNVRHQFAPVGHFFASRPCNHRSVSGSPQRGRAHTSTSGHPRRRGGGSLRFLSF